MPGSPAVKILPSDAGGAGVIPGRAVKIPPVLNQNIKPYCNKFNKGLKNGAHQKQNGNKKQNKKQTPNLMLHRWDLGPCPCLPVKSSFCCSQGAWLWQPPSSYTPLIFTSHLLAFWVHGRVEAYSQMFSKALGLEGVAFASVPVSFLEILLDLAQIPALSQGQRTFSFFLFPSPAAVGFHHFL